MALARPSARAPGRLSANSWKPRVAKRESRAPSSIDIHGVHPDSNWLPSLQKRSELAVRSSSGTRAKDWVRTKTSTSWPSFLRHLPPAAATAPPFLPIPIRLRRPWSQSASASVEVPQPTSSLAPVAPSNTGMRNFLAREARREARNSKFARHTHTGSSRDVRDSWLGAQTHEVARPPNRHEDVTSVCLLTLRDGQKASTGLKRHGQAVLLRETKGCLASRMGILKSLRYCPQPQNETNQKGLKTIVRYVD